MKENAIISAMTDGEWMVTSFIQNSTDITSQFSSYHFKYHNNFTVDAIENGTVVKSGTWQGDINNMSISANFSAAVSPLSFLNGTWHVDNNSWTFVVASQTGGGVSQTLRLEKL